MDKTEFIWLDGKLVKWEDAKVHVLSHALNYGTGVFEGIRVYETPKGPAVFRLKAHTKRLMDGCKVMGFDVVIDGKKYRMDEEGNLYDLNGNPVDDLEIGDISLPEGELGGDLGDIEYGEDFFGTLIPDYSLYLEKPENVTEITAALKRFFGI